MSNYYSSLYQQVGASSSTTYEPVGPVPSKSGQLYVARFTATVPVGFTVADNLYLVPLRGIYVPTASPQLAGVRFARGVITVSGDAGGSVTVNIGGGAGTGQLSGTAFGSASTILQAAATTDIAIATVVAAGPVLVTDDIKLTGVANTTVTARTVSGFFEFFNAAP